MKRVKNSSSNVIVESIVHGVGKQIHDKLKLPIISGEQPTLMVRFINELDFKVGRHTNPIYDPVFRYTCDVISNL